MTTPNTRRRAALRAGVAAAAAVAALAIPAHVSAHTIQPAGQYKLAIGWQHEPTYVGIENAVQVIITGPDGKPFTGFPSTGSGLKVAVSFGKPGGGTLPSTAPLDLNPTADPDTGLGMPGETVASIVPTAAGDYTFHVTGTLGTQNVDITVTSGDTTFNTVKTTDAVQFPNKEQPISNIEAAVTRAQGRADAVGTTASQAAADAQSAKDSANRALVIGLLALVAGVGLGGAGLAFGLRARRGREGTEAG
jgi:hypothetical protein